jgi:hypothetical protein
MRRGMHHSIRFWLAITAGAAAAASGLTLVAAASASATEADGVIAVIAQSGAAITGVEGTTTELSLVGKFTDSGNIPPNVDCTVPYDAVIHWGDNTTSDGLVVCERTTGVANIPTGVFDVGGSHMYQENGTYTISLTVTDTDESESSGAAVNTDTAAISDANISATSATNLGGGGEGATTEGGTVTASAFFFDSNTSFADAGTVDSGLTATINWGDGSTSPASDISWPDCGECGNVEVSASHVYDANIPATKPYSVTITLHDDGGKSATSEAADTPAIADGALTADANKSLTATATKAFTSVVGSFKDAAGAQAAAADFTASISWGDNTTSTGSVSKTASGAFSVSGSHTYASTGSKSITVTVMDEEGQTVTLHATATVAAAPVVLPATGQPQQAASPVMPALPIALLLVGLAAIGAGLRRARVSRR